ncbi:MAG: hypothetical protein MIO93_14555 [ANME-2 cluster archaeon]|jgi:hypothetical protein|nr:hypothetical protein [ANME-2 cluster archaeon]
MYFEISIAAFGVVAFLTLRDIRIFRRTKLESFRKGAMKGMAAMTLALLGVMVVQQNAELGMLLVLIGLFINKKGHREDVFGDAVTADRFLGKTNIKN